MKSNRFLVAFLDTEGVPHRSKSRTELWNSFVMFRYVVEFYNGFIWFEKRDVFHTAHFVQEKHSTHTQKMLQCHFGYIDMLVEKYEVGGVILLCWNAPHDRAVFNYYLDRFKFPKPVGTLFQFVDVLPEIRKLKLGTKSHSLGDVGLSLGCKISGELHTALEDTLLMERIILKVGGEQLLSKCIKAQLRGTFRGVQSVQRRSRRQTL